MWTQIRLLPQQQTNLGLQCSTKKLLNNLGKHSFLNFFEVRNKTRGLPDSSPSGVSTEAQTKTIPAPERHYTRLELRSHKL